MIQLGSTNEVPSGAGNTLGATWMELAPMPSESTPNARKGVKGFVSIPVEQRFWSKVQKGAADECWLWLASTNHADSNRSYGEFWVNGRRVKAHRFAWELAHGRSIPKGLLACHSCDNPRCVNPDHIFIGTHSDNLRDAVQKGRHQSPRGESHPLAVLTVNEVVEMRRLRGEGASAKCLANRYGISVQSVRRIIRGDWWKEAALSPGPQP